MRRTPSVFRIVKVDYLASLGVIAPLVVWGLALAGVYFDSEAAAFFRLGAPTVTVVGLAVTFWRITMIRSVIESGDEVPGVVTSVGFWRGRGRVEYVYTHLSRKMLSGNAVQASGVTRSIAHGQSVTVMVDRLNSKRAFLRELYL